MKVDPMTRILARWVSGMHVALYRLVDGWSPINWNTLVLTVRGRKSGREIAKPLLYLERDGKLYVVRHSAAATDPRIGTSIWWPTRK